MSVIAGGNIIPQAAERIRTATVALAAVDTAGGVAAWQNPEEYPIIVQRVLLDVTTKTTGACTVSVGSAANGTTLSADMIDGKDVGAAAGTWDNITDGGTLGKSRQKLAAKGGATDYVTASVASGASAGIVGFLYIQYWVVDD